MDNKNRTSYVIQGARRPITNISLTPELDAFVEQTVRSGRYASEAVREGLRLLQEREAKFQRLRQDIQDGIESGEGIPFDEKRAGEIKARGRVRQAL